jgi:hypothetical protein
MSVLPDSLMDKLKNIQTNLEKPSRNLITPHVVGLCSRGCYDSCYQSAQSGRCPTCSGSCTGTCSGDCSGSCVSY